MSSVMSFSTEMWRNTYFDQHMMIYSVPWGCGVPESFRKSSSLQCAASKTCISVHSYKNQKERWDLRWTYLQLNEVHLTISWVFSQPPSKTHISGGSTWCKSSRIRSWLRAPTASQPSWSKVTSTSPLGSESWKGSFFIATQQGTWLQYW